VSLSNQPLNLRTGLSGQKRNEKPIQTLSLRLLRNDK
jgi:hypothetical protein